MMKLLSFTLALAMAQGILFTSGGGCDANNCARAVTGTRTGKMPDVTSRMADCSNFMLVTVTPATSTVTAYATVTNTITLPGMKKRLEERLATSFLPTTSSVPVYASACSTASAYSSACSCWGITAMTTEAPNPITTTTVTVTAMATACPVADTLCGSSCSNLETDPMNCGACNNACASGVCDSGSCTNPACAGTACPNFNMDCSPNSSCFCVGKTEGSGACATPNWVCVPCTSSDDCGDDSVCAVNTCCGVAGTCTLSVKACGPDVPPSKLMIREYTNATQASLGTWVD